jgi:hypothetical protein
MTEQAPIEIGKFRLIGKRWHDELTAELIFEAGDLLKPIKFFVEGKTTSIILPLAVAERHTLGHRYTLFSKGDAIYVEP